MGLAHWFDELAKSAGEADPSRRAALRTAGAGFLGAIAMLAFGGRALADDDDDTKNGKGPKCPAGMAKCSGNCRDVAIDPDNCGGCGKVCPDGSVCRKGVCETQCPPPSCLPPCPPGLAFCNGMCAVTAIDPSNCGACGRTCPSGQVCVNGQCTTTCPPGQTFCGGSCVSTTTDPNNCGTCGTHCASGVCANGVCTVASDAACAGKTAGDVCSFTNGSGVCTVSGGGLTCVGTCNAGFANCNGTLADGCETNIFTSSANCGGCGITCPAGATCVNGACTFPDAACANKANGDVCTVTNGTGVCTNGQCLVATCNAGFADCNGNRADGCETNTLSDAQNCGACLHSCAAGQTCVNGVCTTTSCPPGQVLCNGLCITANSITNCGGCGIVCTFPNATAACVNGVCAIATCNPGFANCDGQVANGCEINTNVDARNCGGCGIVCPTGQSCIGGVCQCPAGTRDCGDGVCHPLTFVCP